MPEAPPPRASLSDAPLSVDAVNALVAHPGAGGTALFLGTVRDVNAGLVISLLEYHAYPELAVAEMGRILAEIQLELPGVRVAVAHRVGALAVGDLAIVAAASAPHRGEAFRACREVVDRVKARVPIWKREHGPNGPYWVDFVDARCVPGDHGHHAEHEHSAPHGAHGHRSEGLGPAQQQRKLRGAIPSRSRAASSLRSSTCKSRPPVLVPQAPDLARSHTARCFLCCCAGPSRRQIWPPAASSDTDGGMELPGTLSQSTLGDLLGALLRAEQSGTLDLRETKGPKAGTVHRIHLRRGLVTAVQLAVDEHDHAPPDEAALDRAHVIQSIELLYALPDARLSFHVARRRVESARPLSTSDYLHGRPRRRDTVQGRQDDARKASESQKTRALATLGLSSNASLTEAHRAFRMLALKLHPDHHGEVSAAEKQQKTARFVSVLAAYQELTAKAG